MDKKIGDLSGGWKRKAAIICSIIHRPSILFLDEPTAGLDTRSRHMLWELVRGLNRDGTTIFLTTHYIEEAEALCDRVGIINHGKLVAIGTVSELISRVGKVAVEMTENDGKMKVDYFSDRESAKVFADGLGDVYYTVRRTTLEDVFLELTGESRGKLA